MKHMYNQTFEEYLETLDRKLQWILINGKKIYNSKNRMSFTRIDEKTKDIVILNERYIITKENNPEVFNQFVEYSVLSNKLYNSANKLYKKQFFNTDNNFDDNKLKMKFYQEFKNSIFNNIQCDFNSISKEELNLRNTFLETPRCIRLGVIYDVSNKWYKFMESCYKYYLKEINDIPSIPKIRKGKDRRNSFTVNTDSIKIISNKEYIHPTNRIKKSKYSKKSIINYRNILILPEQFGNLKIPVNCYKGNIVEVRITPNRNRFVVDVKHTRQINLGKKFTKGIYFKSKNRIAGIDFGLDNLMAIANNTGSKPLLIKGKRLIGINSFYNDLLKKCKLNSNKYKRLEMRRQHIMYDILNKSVHHLIDYLEINRIGVLVLGVNDSMLQNSFLSLNNNEIIKKIDFKYLIQKIKIECNKINIEVKEIKDENLSSITDLLDNGCAGNLHMLHHYGTRLPRKHRLLYSLRFGLVNCDINSAINIITKYKYSAFNYILNKIRFNEYVKYSNRISKSDIEYIIQIKNKITRKTLRLIFKKDSIINVNELFGKLILIGDKSKTKISIFSKNATLNALKKSARKSMAFMFSPIIIN